MGANASEPRKMRQCARNNGYGWTTRDHNTTTPLTFIRPLCSSSSTVGWRRSHPRLANIFQRSTGIHPKPRVCTAQYRCIVSSSFPHRLEHLNHAFHFRPPATGMSTFRSQPGGSTQTHNTHAVLSTQCIVEDVQLADAENRGQKRRWMSLLRHTLLLLQRQAASGQSARRYRAAGCPHLEQGWPQGS